jgi:RNA polymerase sigma-70 factor, ECF subfamily
MRALKETTAGCGQAGGGQAWGEVWRAHRHWLYCVAYDLTHDPDDAADLQQETFRRVLQYAPDHLASEQVHTVRGYLKNTARKTFFTQLKVARRVKQEPVEDAPEPVNRPASDDDPDLAALVGHDVQALRRALTRLDPRHNKPWNCWLRN